MPEIEIQHIVSCSSADKNNPAENLLNPNGSHKWKSAGPGEKSVSCVLQLIKSSQIHSIDVGNEGSAFVEVLVGKATAASDQDFEVLLVASAFMSPLESRNGTNRNAVRMFGPDKLNSVTACQKWDRVKIVCTQPFSKLSAAKLPDIRGPEKAHVAITSGNTRQALWQCRQPQDGRAFLEKIQLSQYGLSFIKFHSPPGEENGETKMKKFGAFAVKDNEDDTGDGIKVGSLFANRSVKDDSPASVPKGAAALRAASKLAEMHTKTSLSLAASSSSTATSSKKTLVVPPLSVSRKDEVSSKAKSDGEEENDEWIPVKTSLKRKSTSISSVSSAASTRGEKSALKRTHTEPATPSPAKAFSKLMERVIFVLSGFQNPYRGELRDKALEMGATYRPDWSRDCTHLVCAFTNTPKYQQVAGKGKIVAKGWVLDCYKQKRLLPWRSYRLGDADTPDESSDDEEVSRSQPKRQDRKATPPPLPACSPAFSKESKTTRTMSFDDTDSGGDTEDELRKVREKVERVQTEGAHAQEAKATSKKPGDPYGDSTDEDEPSVLETIPMDVKDSGSDSGLPDLPDFFTDKHFFFYGEFDSAQRRLLTRYIAAFNGEVEEYMSKKVNFVISAHKWDDNFDEAASENPQLVFVKPAWISACHDKNKLMSYQPYIVVP